MNGPYNFVGDGDVEKWIGTLEAARKLGATVVCPGHGPRGAANVLDDQQLFFKELREQVGAIVKAGKNSHEIYQSVPKIGEALTNQPQIARYVDKKGLAAQVEKIYNEMSGEHFPSDIKRSGAARLAARTRAGWRST